MAGFIKKRDASLPIVRVPSILPMPTGETGYDVFNDCNGRLDYAGFND